MHHSQALSRLHADARSCKRDLEMLKTSVKEQEKEEQRLAKALEDRRKSRPAEAAQAEQLGEEVERLRAELKEKTGKLQAVSSGGVGASGSIRETLKTARTQAAKFEAEDFSVVQEIDYLKNELEEFITKDRNARAVRLHCFFRSLSPGFLSVSSSPYGGRCPMCLHPHPPPDYRRQASLFCCYMRHPPIPC